MIKIFYLWLSIVYFFIFCIWIMYDFLYLFFFIVEINIKFVLIRFESFIYLLIEVNNILIYFLCLCFSARFMLFFLFFSIDFFILIIINYSYR